MKQSFRLSAASFAFAGLAFAQQAGGQTRRLANNTVIDNPSVYAFRKISPSINTYELEAGDARAVVHLGRQTGRVDFSREKNNHKTSYENNGDKVSVDGKELPRESKEATRIRQVALALERTSTDAQNICVDANSGFRDGDESSQIGQLLELCSKDSEPPPPAASPAKPAVRKLEQ